MVSSLIFIFKIKNAIGQYLKNNIYIFNKLEFITKEKLFDQCLNNFFPCEI